MIENFMNFYDTHKVFSSLNYLSELFGYTHKKQEDYRILESLT